MRKAWFAVLVGMFLLGTPLVANAQKGEYVIDRLDPNSPPLTEPWQSWATAINYRGQVVGVSTKQSSYINHATRWVETATPPPIPEKLATLGGANGEAYGINDDGVISGRSQTTDGFWSACTWSLDNPPTNLTPGLNSIAYAINRENAVGYVTSLNKPWYWPLVGGPGGKLCKNDTPEAKYAGQAYAIAPGRFLAAGYIFCWLASGGSYSHAALLFPDDHDDLGTLPGGWESYAYGVNNYGQAAGKSSFPQEGRTGVHAVMWDAQGNITDLGTLAGPDYGYGYYSEARAINARGHVVGWSHDKYGTKCAFLWTPERGMKDLNLLLSANDQYRWTLNEATGINNRGQIVGHGIYKGSTNSGKRGFRLTPLTSQTDIPYIRLLLLEKPSE